jgi:hypothetical protein
MREIWGLLLELAEIIIDLNRIKNTSTGSQPNNAITLRAHICKVNKTISTRVVSTNYTAVLFNNWKLPCRVGYSGVTQVGGSFQRSLRVSFFNAAWLYYFIHSLIFVCTEPAGFFTAYEVSRERCGTVAAAKSFDLWRRRSTNLINVILYLRKRAKLVCTSS